MPRPFVFFDLGQTLIDEWEFIEFLDSKFLEVLNGFGARIDTRNYAAVRDSVIRNRMIGYGSARDLVVEVCKLLSPAGYEKAILNRLEPELKEARLTKFKIANDATATLTALAEKGVEMGLIANQSRDILGILERSGLEKFFKVKVISSVVQLAKPDPGIFQLALDTAAKSAADCMMVGDRLDTDICPAKSLGMTTIRYTNSLFSLQVPARDCEHPDYSVARLAEIPALLERIIFR
jgi:HAD superfamily hydrolase (TIGR01549 family)